MDYVVDFSFAACWFVSDEDNPSGQRLLSLHKSGNADLVCPELWQFELLNFLALSRRRGRMSADAIEDSLLLLSRLKIHFHSQKEAVVAARVLKFAESYRLTGYDAAYLEIADRLQIPLLTLDSDLLSAAKKRSLRTSI